MKQIITSLILILIAAFLTAFCIAEISFPETFLTITDKNWFLEIFPKAWKYNIQIALGALILAIVLIIPAYKIQKDFTCRALETLIRLGLGGMFIFASLFKIQDPLGFAVLVAQYQFLPDFINNFFALFYPQLEFFFGLALIVTPFTKESGLVILLMFISFIIALSWALFKDLGITCGCFQIEGAQSKNETWTSLIRDLILLVPNIFLLTRKNKSLITLWKEFSQNK